MIRLVAIGPSATTIINGPISINFAANSFCSVIEKAKKNSSGKDRTEERKEIGKDNSTQAPMHTYTNINDVNTHTVASAAAAFYGDRFQFDPGYH